MAPGFCYACKCDAAVKIGMTTCADVFDYLNKNYSRTYSSWTLLALVWTPDCALAERMTLFTLRDQKCSNRHELVLAPDTVILQAFDAVSMFFFSPPSSTTWI